MLDSIHDEQEHILRIQKSLESMPTDDDLAEIGDRFKTLSEPSRLKILFALKNGELCVEHITKAVNGNQSGVSHQLKTLKDNKIIKSRRDGKNILYSIVDWHIMTILEISKEHLNCDDKNN